MKYYFLRHAETIEGACGIILGSLDGVLSEKGKIQAKNLGKQFLKEGIIFDKIISSHQKRTIDTAMIYATVLGISQMESDSCIRERSAGEVEGKNEIDIDWESYEKKPFIYRKHQGGESFLDVKKRARIFLDSLKKLDDGNVLIISHSVFIAACIAVIENMSMKKATKVDIKNAIPILDSAIGEFQYRKID